MADTPDGVRDGQVHAVARTELADRQARLHALRDLPVVRRLGLREGLAATQALAERAVARQGRRAGGDEVAEPEARRLLREMAARLPGYLVPKLVREEPGARAKTTLAPLA